jgi:hypothetical protein
VNLTKGDGSNIQKFEEATRPNIVREYKTAPGLKALREADVSMHHRYSDRNGVFVVEIVVAPDDIK